MRLFAEPLQFAAGELVLPAGFAPAIDVDALAAHMTASERSVPARAGWTAPID